MLKPAFLALATASALLLASCGGSDAPATKSGSGAAAEGDGTDPWSLYANPGWNHDGANVKKTDSGLEYIVVTSGTECESGPKNGDQAFVHYEGRLTDGTVFDSSLARGVGINFPANRVIPGWTEALGMMCPGDDWMVYLPSDIAYGDSPRPGGPIKPGDDLIFRVILMAQIAEQDWSGENFR